jgi:hypothetical protein
MRLRDRAAGRRHPYRQTHKEGPVTGAVSHDGHAARRQARYGPHVDRSRMSPREGAEEMAGQCRRRIGAPEGLRRDWDEAVRSRGPGRSHAELGSRARSRPCVFPGPAASSPAARDAAAAIRVGLLRTRPRFPTSRPAPIENAWRVVKILSTICRQKAPFLRSLQCAREVPMTAIEHIPTDLTLEIEDDLSPERFIATARAFFGYVQEISTTFAPDGEIPSWIVRVREGSTLLALDPSPRVPGAVAEVIFARAEKGIERLVNGSIDESGLPDSAIRHLKVLAEMAEGTLGKNRPVGLRFWIKRKPFPVEPVLARILREDERADYRDWGTIEGRLQVIQEGHRGNLQFQLMDVALRQKVRCYFPEELLSEVFDKFRRRVEVTGMIHYRKSGVAISIDAERIEALPDDSELPSAADVRGILRS